jgi:hypothetical protein
MLYNWIVVCKKFIIGKVWIVTKAVYCDCDFSRLLSVLPKKFSCMTLKYTITNESPIPLSLHPYIILKFNCQYLFISQYIGLFNDTVSTADIITLNGKI